MKYDFEFSEDFAKQLDRKDDLLEYRDRFHVPDGTIYLDGNSLGLASKNAEESILRVLDEWKELGIRGWLEGEQPWFYFAEELGKRCAELVGAEEEEVVATGTTTVNIHSLISTFYEPKNNRTKILADELNFPSDLYALKGQIELKCLDPEEELILVPSEDGLTLDEEKIVEHMTDEVALILLPSVLYRSGQLLDIQYLTEEAHKRDIPIGFDCSHSVGAVPHEFDKWNVDFAMWCSYKYLNGGPGSTAFIYLNKEYFDKEPKLKGWFGYQKDKQFDLNVEFAPSKNAGGWQISSPAILNSAPLEGSFDIIEDAGIKNIRKKSKKITSYFVYLVEELLSEKPYNFKIGTPLDPDKRSGHIALMREKEAFRINEALKSMGVVPDFRPPNIIRIAPIALYNTYYEVWQVVQYLKKIIDEEKYKEFSKERKAIS